MSHDIFGTLLHDLRCEIERGLIHQTWIVNEQDPEATLFAPLDLSEGIIGRGIQSFFRAISDDRDIERDVKIALHPETSVCRILAILIWIECDADILKDFRRNFTSSNATHDSDLPIEQQAARDLFGDRLGDKFFYKQFIFCPVVLHEDKEVEYKAHRQFCRLPFQDSIVLGKGSSGTVCKVTIAAGHLNSSNPIYGPNKQPEIFAWKGFTRATNSNHYKKERENLQTIKESGFKHPNILLATGGLIRGDVYSLYFKAAPYDLDQYLKSSEIPIPRDALGVHTFLRHFRGLVDALKFLHNELVSADNSVALRFTHLDLKPTNILVFLDPKPEIWKIHDFGFSRVSPKNPHEVLQGWQRLLPSTATENSSCSSIIPRDGSFLAPETNDLGKVKAASDIWSLGCILSLVISFLDDGPRSIKHFEEERKKGADVISDHFFVRKGNNHTLNPGVTNWFKKLKQRFSVSLVSSSEPRILLAIRGIIYLLNHRILLIKPDKRVNSQEMENLFDNILSQLNSRPSLNRSETITIRRPIIDRLQSLLSKEDKALNDPAKHYELSIALGSRRSKFSHCGEYLAYLAPKVIAIYNTRSILKTDCKQTLKSCGPGRIPRLAQITGSKWDSYEIGSLYLVASTNQEHFDCYVYPHSAPEQQASLEDPLLRYFYHFTLNEERSKIHKMALSPDNKFLVHILKEPNQRISIYLSRISDMILWLQGNQSVDGNSVTASKSSTHSSEPVILPWKHIILESKKKHKIHHVQMLQFSADSQLFTLSSEPPNFNECVFYAWNTQTGKYVNRIVFETPGNIDTSQEWITAFTTLMPKPAIQVIMFQRVLRQGGFAPEVPNWKSVEMDVELLDVLPLRNSDDRYVFIGREKRKGGPIKALYIERNKLKEKMSKMEFQYTIDLECDDWMPGRDAAATLDDGHLFVIARVDDRGYVKTFIRPNAPKMAGG